MNWVQRYTSVHTRNAIVNQVKSLGQSLQLLSVDFLPEDETPSLLKRCQYYGKLLLPNGDWLTSEMTEESLRMFSNAYSESHKRSRLGKINLPGNIVRSDYLEPAKNPLSLPSHYSWMDILVPYLFVRGLIPSSYVLSCTRHPAPRRDFRYR